MTETLGARLSARDAARFVGRSAELARLEPLLGADAPANVVLLHGPGGVGKSTLMREFARRAAERGWTPITAEARDIAPLAEALDEALAPALSAERPLLLLDSWDGLAALDSYLRSEILARLPPDAIVMLVTRRPPGSGWHSGGWEHVVLEMRLGPLPAPEADALLAARGVTDPGRRAAAIGWARGSPLALVLAAEAGGAPETAPGQAVQPGIAGTGQHTPAGQPTPARQPTPVSQHAATGAPSTTGPTTSDPTAGTSRPAESGQAALTQRLLDRLLDAQPDGEHRTVLAVAALARVTTPSLLARVLPDLDASRAFGWLAAHPSAESLRDGVMLHELIGRVVREDLRRRSPELERDLRRRLVDELYASAASAGLLRLTLDLQHLVQDPSIRWGFAWDASGTYWIDAPRPGDIDAIAARAGRTAMAWLDGARRYFREAPGLVAIVRDRDGVVAGYGVSVTPANAPAWAAADPLVGPQVRHAAARVPDRAAVICRQAIDLTGELASPVTGLLGMAAIIGSGLDNPAAAYLPIRRGDTAAEAFSAACGAHALPELATVHGGVAVECHLLDYGPGGLLAFQRAAVYRELGLPPPPLPPPPPTVRMVRDALRNYGSPALLAASPLARQDGTPPERAGIARARIDDAVRVVFGPSREDQIMRNALVRGYLDPAPTHERAAAELHLSRTAYFRHLRAAVERVAVQLGAQANPRTGTDPGPSRH